MVEGSRFRAFFDSFFDDVEVLRPAGGCDLGTSRGDVQMTGPGHCLNLTPKPCLAGLRNSG